jgi:alpha-glucosidase
MTLRILILLTFISFTVYSQSKTVVSPNQKIKIELVNSKNADYGAWYFKVYYLSNGKTSEVFNRIDVGLLRDDQEFSNNLALRKTGKPQLVKDEYTAIHGKRTKRNNAATEVVYSFETPAKAKINIALRAYNDGCAFRYEFPETKGSFVVKDEFTAYSIPKKNTRWMESWNAANERTYLEMNGDQVQSQEWCYPALVQASDSSCWFLLHEADVNGDYCGTKLSNVADVTKYKLTFPNPDDGRGTGKSTPAITLPWKSPWRVIIIGGLADIVGSTLVDDVSTPSKIEDTSWIKPGLVSWNYWSSNHGTRDYQVVCKFADLAAEMGWMYTLLDWEWDKMGNGGNLNDAVNYIRSKGVKPLLWYNSGGNHTWVTETPVDRMVTHKNRTEEFTKLQKMGVAGIKVDFFESEKQNMIQYYLDILEDAAKYKMLVYFHGCLVPRGWARTYPNLMTYEAVKGAEWYNNIQDFTMEAPLHNSVLPFTRNVVGSMDYTPVTFTNSQHPHVTSYGHELALSVLFESALQHMADRPEGYTQLPDAPKKFLSELPNAWDDTRLLAGYPGRDVTLARRKGEDWYIAGINAEVKEKRQSILFDFLPDGKQYILTLISDGDHDKVLASKYLVVDKSSTVEVKLLRRGGFAGSLKPVR